MARAERSRRGFTVLEMVVALAVSGLVLLGARVVLTQLSDDAARIAVAAREADGRANGERLLRAIVARFEAMPSSTVTVAFSGDETESRFSTWCDTPAGWLERCEASVVITTVAGRRALVLQLPSSPQLVVRSGFREAELRYLESAEGGGMWLRRWGGGVKAPLALGVFTDRDTVVLRIGERG